VAEKVRSAKQAGNDVVVVVSAMAGETNRLIALANQIAEIPDEREKDVLLASGEQVSVALLSLALKELGQMARSYLGHQVRIETDNAYGKAHIRNIDSTKIIESLKNGEVVVVAGFQGVDEDDNITTLGRGGSTPAQSWRRFSTPPPRSTGCRRALPPTPALRERAKIGASPHEMIELASTGAKVLRSAPWCSPRNIPFPSMSARLSVAPRGPVVDEEASMNDVLASACPRQERREDYAAAVPDCPGLAAQIFGSSRAHIVVDMIIQNASEDGTTDLTFTVPKADHKKALAIVEKTAPAVEAKGVKVDTDIAKVSVVGVGMRTHAGVAAKMFDVLAREGINIEMISTSEIKISVVIEAKHAELAVRVLHDAFVEKQGNV
jgi:aspartate kinase